jgi:hypothetical protein
MNPIFQYLFQGGLSNRAATIGITFYNEERRILQGNLANLRTVLILHTVVERKLGFERIPLPWKTYLGNGRFLFVLSMD